MQNSVLLSDLFGCMSLINIGLLSVASLALMWGGDKIAAIHSRLFGIAADKIKIMYMNYLAQYKILIFVFNVVPYLALEIIF
jgi:hypothetical protein